jgi:Suppressor of fused protein (SUFU)
MKLEKYQASVLAFLFDSLPIGDDVDSLEFSLSGGFAGKYCVAHSAIKSSDQSARIVFTLPSYSQSVFFALTRTKLNDVARILANLEDYERETSMPLGLGEVVLTPEQIQHGVSNTHAVILLRTATSFDCARVPDSKVIDGKQTLFFFVVPLTKDEWELRRQRGHDVLMNWFQDNEKELFF